MSGTASNAQASNGGAVGDDHKFEVPVKLIKSPNDAKTWESTAAYHEYLSFILTLNDACEGKRNSIECPASKPIENLIRLLDKLDKIIDETPPFEQPQRFGNKAFKNWLEKVTTNAHDLLKEVIPEAKHSAIKELAVYFAESFGNATRIDYGTGHEINFLMMLYCLFKINVLREMDGVTVVCRVFERYLRLVRKLQLTYRMEPAGSHGVWSLDDYQFVPFIWGSSQLVRHPKIAPCSFLDAEILANHAHDYLFLGCIDYINQVKTGPFAEHSNQLWGVSAVDSWSKVNKGLIKMYKAEILSKFPVVQHIYFGSLLRFETQPQPFRVVNRRMPMNLAALKPPTLESGDKCDTGANNGVDRAL